MTLKSKIAKILRKWAENLEPIFPYDVNHISHLKEVTHDIQKIMSQHSIPRYVYDRDPDRMNRLVREDISSGIAKELDANGLIKITIEPTPECVNYIGELYIIDACKK